MDATEKSATPGDSSQFKFDANTVLAMLYLLYKSNMISRMNLAQMLKEVKKPWPEDVAKYLVEESVK